MAVEVSTFAELVAACANASTKDSENVVKLANNISVVNEFPNGDCPQLTVNCTLDGNGKTINDWYCTRTGNEGSSVYLISLGAYGKIRNLTCSNINHNGTILYSDRYNKFKNEGEIQDSFFSGRTSYYGMYCGISSSSQDDTFIRCSFNLECGVAFCYAARRPIFQDCYIIADTSTLFYIESFRTNDKKSVLTNCYVEAKLDNMARSLSKGKDVADQVSISNSVLDITPKGGTFLTAVSALTIPMSGTLPLKTALSFSVRFSMTAVTRSGTRTGIFSSTIFRITPIFRRRTANFPLNTVMFLSLPLSSATIKALRRSMAVKLIVITSISRFASLWRTPSAKPFQSATALT